MSRRKKCLPDVLEGNGFEPEENKDRPREEKRGPGTLGGGTPIFFFTK